MLRRQATVLPIRGGSGSGLLGLEANASYLWGDFEPFARITYEIDLSHDNVLTPGAANDTNDILVGLGVNWYLNDGVSAGVSYERSLDRDDFEADSITIQLRADF